MSCFEKTLEIDQTKNGKQHEKNENRIANILKDNNENLKTLENILKNQKKKKKKL